MGKENKNIYYNHKLEEYNKKYSKWGGLRRYTKKEVEEFDKKNPTSIKNFLLINRSWWLIGDTYYQIPKSPVRWFKNLSVAGKVTCCLLTGAVVATGVAVPTTIAIKNNIEANRTYDYKVDYKVANKDCDIKFLSESDKQISYGIAVKESSSETITGISYVRVGSHSLKENEEYEYSLDSEDNTLVVSINKEVFSKYKGEVKIKVEFDEGPGPGPEEPGIWFDDGESKTVTAGEYITLTVTTTGTTEIPEFEVDENYTDYITIKQTGELEVKVTGTKATEDGDPAILYAKIPNSESYATCYITVDEAEQKEMTISGDQNIEIIDKDTEHELVASFKEQKLDDVVYTTESDAISITGNKFKVSENSKGGSVIIKANKSGYEESEFEIEVASFKYVDCDDPTNIRASQSLKDASANSVDLVIPSRKFDDEGVATALTGWYVNYDSGEGAFSGCSALKSVYIPNSFKEVGPISFQDSDNLSSVTFQNGIKYIGQDAFSGSNVTSFNIPKSVIAFGDSALNPSKCTSIVFDDVYSSLEDSYSSSFTPTTNASQNASEFKAINEGSVVNKIYTFVINGVDNIDIDSLQDKYEYTITGTLPDNIKLITTGNLGTYELDATNNKVILTLSEEAKSNGGYGTIEVVAETGQLGYFNISCGSFNKLDKDRLEASGSGSAKAKDKNITGKVVIPAYYVLGTGYGNIGLNKIQVLSYDQANDSGAFTDCTQITNVVISELISIINIQAFQGCTSLSQVTVLGNLTQIENNAFEETAITSFNIQNSVAWIGPEAFKTCNSLNSVIFDNKEGWHVIDGEDPITISEDSSINATNLKNCVESTQDNWGCTGITTW